MSKPKTFARFCCSSTKSESVGNRSSDHRIDLLYLSVFTIGEHVLLPSRCGAIHITAGYVKYK